MDFSRFYHETVVAWYSGNEVDAANVDVSSLILPSLPFSLIFHPRLNRVNSRGEIFPHIYKLSIGSECTANTNFSVEIGINRAQNIDSSRFRSAAGTKSVLRARKISGIYRRCSVVAIVAQGARSSLT